MAATTAEATIAARPFTYSSSASCERHAPLLGSVLHTSGQYETEKAALPATCTEWRRLGCGPPCSAGTNQSDFWLNSEPRSSEVTGTARSSVASSGLSTVRSTFSISNTIFREEDVDRRGERCLELASTKAMWHVAAKVAGG